MTQQQQHPIVPPPQWQMDAWQASIETMGADVPAILLEAAQWGADQELEYWVDWISEHDWTWTSAQLRATRRPKPPSLKEQALEALERFSVHAHAYADEMMADFDLISRALEQLDD
jgi:hypothetical protein